MYLIKCAYCSCTDVGGQAHEQEEWRRIYEAQEVHAILYICALSEFDNVDKATDKNALTEQFRLLRRVMENEVFSQSSTIVLLNKIDILETKLEHRDMSDFMSGFKKKNNNVDGVVNTFIKKVKKTHEKLQVGNTDKSRPQPVVLASCALDTSLMETLICQALRQTLVRNLNKFFE
jgi:50S ribosomal subunit-associated GTPase HflX